MINSKTSTRLYVVSITSYLAGFIFLFNGEFHNISLLYFITPVIAAIISGVSCLFINAKEINLLALSYMSIATTCFIFSIILDTIIISSSLLLCSEICLMLGLVIDNRVY